MDRKTWARRKIQMVPERWVLFFVVFLKIIFAAKMTTYVNWGCIHFGQKDNSLLSLFVYLDKKNPNKPQNKTYLPTGCQNLKGRGNKSKVVKFVFKHHV